MREDLTRRGRYATAGGLVAVALVVVYGLAASLFALILVLDLLVEGGVDLASLMPGLLGLHELGFEPHWLFPVFKLPVAVTAFATAYVSLRAHARRRVASAIGWEPRIVVAGLVSVWAVFLLGGAYVLDNLYFHWPSVDGLFSLLWVSVLGAGLGLTLTALGKRLARTAPP